MKTPTITIHHPRLLKGVDLKKGYNRLCRDQQIGGVTFILNIELYIDEDVKYLDYTALCDPDEFEPLFSINETIKLLNKIWTKKKLHSK